MFQLEKRMTGKIMQMQPTELSHLIAMIAVPAGSMVSIPETSTGCMGAKVTMPTEAETHPRETYGHAVYQEQVMQAAIALAG